MSEVLRIAVFADIHSNIHALRSCIEDSRRLGVQEYIVAGDIISDWHKPNECVDTVRELTKIVIKGNREQYLRDSSIYIDLWRIYDQFASLLWTQEQLTRANAEYLNSLPPALTLVGNNIKLRIVHGSPFRINELMYKDGDKKALCKSLEAISEDVLIFAHSHEQWKFEHNGKLAVNPGSVGVHHNKECGAEYVVLEISDDKITVIFRCVPYDLNEAFRELIRTDLYKRAYVWVLVNYLGMVRGSNELLNFLNLVEKERRHDEFSLGGPIPNDVYNRVFDEHYADIISELILR